MLPAACASCTLRALLGFAGASPGRGPCTDRAADARRAGLARAVRLRRPAAADAVLCQVPGRPIPAGTGQVGLQGRLEAPKTVARTQRQQSRGAKEEEQQLILVVTRVSAAPAVRAGMSLLGAMHARTASMAFNLTCIHKAGFSLSTPRALPSTEQHSASRAAQMSVANQCWNPSNA